MSEKTKIVVVGAGFGGVRFVRSLHKKPLDILLIDRNNYHNFQPLMYQVATGGLEPGSITYPVRRIFRKYKNVSFRMAEVTRIIPERNEVETSLGTVSYDFLVIASGSENLFFNFEPVKDRLFALKSLPEALQMRNQIFRSLEQALADRNSRSLEEILNIAIVGGGPAGIELAGALAEMRKNIVAKEFPDLPRDSVRINLYQSGPKLLPGMSEQASAKSLKYLRELGVNVFLNTRAQDYKKPTLVLSDGSQFITNTVIWTAGVKGSTIPGLPETCTDNKNRILVNAFNQLITTDNIFAIGDIASHSSEENHNGLPMLAPVAQQQGKHLAKNILKKLENKPMKPFSYHNKGVMATIGRKKAVVDLPHYKFQGGFAWFVWMVVHIFSLVGFRDKAVTFIDWIINYFTYDQPSGMILSAAGNQSKEKQEESKKTEVL